ncbi:hypothetical protein [Kitasatospora griseola]|uniref:hypothetical protein n=1 Tax=Kitasatospora griseola TaxID=2064 RepID=UPI001670F7C2|nr:hypothetical protein [Kitasatospora griseola]GGQ68136.1 hypothetical protein GCM10010195_24780 [Kitasatospora griseola]
MATGVAGVYGRWWKPDAISGPLVRLGEVDLVGRVPSQVGVEVRRLAAREGVAVRTNPVGDPEVAAWGLSMGAAQAWGPGPYGYPQCGEAQLSEVLLVAPELAADPYAVEPVRRRRDLVDRPANPGAWPVAADLQRPRWNWTPGASVGLLRFGMSPEQVSRALCGATPTLRRGHPHWTNRPYRDWPHQTEPPGPVRWSLAEEHYADLGVTAEYRCRRAGFPVLGAVTVAGRTGPQLHFAGIPLVGRPLTEVEADPDPPRRRTRPRSAVRQRGRVRPAGRPPVRAARPGRRPDDQRRPPVRTGLEPPALTPVPP